MYVGVKYPTLLGVLSSHNIMYTYLFYLVQYRNAARVFNVYRRLVVISYHNIINSVSL